MNGIRTLEAQARFEALRSAYNSAFRQFSLSVGQLRSLLSLPAPDIAAVEEAKLRVEQARTAYRESRDLLVQFMLSRDVTAADRGVDWKSQVESLAHQIWEESGRPAGKAEEHWYRAESLLRNTPEARLQGG